MLALVINNSLVPASSHQRETRSALPLYSGVFRTLTTQMHCYIVQFFPDIWKNAHDAENATEYITNKRLTLDGRPKITLRRNT